MKKTARFWSIRITGQNKNEVLSNGQWIVKWMERVRAHICRLRNWPPLGGLVLLARRTGQPLFNGVSRVEADERRTFVRTRHIQKRQTISIGQRSERWQRSNFSQSRRQKTLRTLRILIRAMDIRKLPMRTEVLLFLPVARPKPKIPNTGPKFAEWPKLGSSCPQRSCPILQPISQSRRTARVFQMEQKDIV